MLLGQHLVALRQVGLRDEPGRDGTLERLLGARVVSYNFV